MTFAALASQPFLEIRKLAAEVFEDEAYAESWLSEANTALGEKSPQDVVVHEQNGFATVRNLLPRIHYGVLA